MEFLVVFGRILYALLFLGSGLAGHFMATGATAQYAETRGVSQPKILVQLSGVVLILGAIGVGVGIWIDLAALLLIAFLLAANVMVHHFWSDGEGMLRQMEMTQFMKNLSLIGAGLVIIAVADSMGPMLVGPLF